jgi:hypothetical protein
VLFPTLDTSRLDPVPATLRAQYLVECREASTSSEAPFLEDVERATTGGSQIRVSAATSGSSQMPVVASPLHPKRMTARKSVNAVKKDPDSPDAVQTAKVAHTAKETAYAAKTVQPVETTQPHVPPRRKQTARKSSLRVQTAKKQASRPPASWPAPKSAELQRGHLVPLIIQSAKVPGRVGPGPAPVVSGPAAAAPLEVPAWVRCPTHAHPLKLIRRPMHYECSPCGRKYNDFYYVSSGLDVGTDFVLCIGCGLNNGGPARYSGHPHPLQLGDRGITFTCDGLCGQEKRERCYVSGVEGDNFTICVRCVEGDQVLDSDRRGAASPDLVGDEDVKSEESSSSSAEPSDDEEVESGSDDEGAESVPQGWPWPCSSCFPHCPFVLKLTSLVRFQMQR